MRTRDKNDTNPLPCYRSSSEYEKNVRYGPKADISQCNRYVRSTPKSGHSALQMGCPLWVKVGQNPVSALCLLCSQ